MAENTTTTTTPAADVPDMPADIAAARAARQAWKAKPQAERDAAYNQALADIASGRVQPEGIDTRN